MLPDHYVRAILLYDTATEAHFKSVVLELHQGSTLTLSVLPFLWMTFPNGFKTRHYGVRYLLTMVL